MNPIYRIYDTVEKRHCNNIIVTSKWWIYKIGLWKNELDCSMEYAGSWRYIVERCTSKWSENDIVSIKWYVDWFMPIQAIVYNETEACLWVWDSRDWWHSLWWLDFEIIGHAITHSHLLSGE